MYGWAFGALLLLAQNDVKTQGEQAKEIPPLKQVMVVTGSRTEELQTDSAIKVEVLTRKQMQETGNERLTDVLSEIPGVMTRRGSTATVGGQQIQGIDSRQVLVLQDGLPMIGALELVSGGPTGEPGGSSAFRLAAVWGRFAASGLDVPRGPVLLVDDLVDSRWTMTVAAHELRTAGATAVLPFALAVRG